MKLLMKVSNIFDHTINFLAYLAGVCLILIVLLIGAEVMTRLLLGRSLLWVIELSEFSLLYLTFLGTAWVLRRGGHVTLDLVLNRLNPRAQSLLNAVTFSVGAIVCLVVAWYSAETAWDMFQRSVSRLTIVRFPMAPLLAIISVGSFLLFIQFLRGVYGYLRSWRASKDQEQSLP